MTFLMGGLLGIMIGMNNVTQVVPYVRLFWIIPLVVGVMKLAKFVKWRQNTESLLTLKIWTFTTVEMLLFNVSIAILSGVYNINTMPLS